MIYKLLAISCYALALVCARHRCPRAARCPVGFDLRAGIRPSGAFQCWPSPVGDPDWDGTWQRSPDRSTQPGGVREGWIYCTSGSVPIVVDDRAVACGPAGGA